MDPCRTKQESLSLIVQFWSINVSHCAFSGCCFYYVYIQSGVLTPCPQGTRAKEPSFLQKECGGRDPHMITVARQALISGRSLLSHQLQPASINQSSKANRPQLTNPQVGQMLKASSWVITHDPPTFIGKGEQIINIFVLYWQLIISYNKDLLNII